MIWDIVAAIVIAWLVIVTLPLVFWGAVWVIIAITDSAPRSAPRSRKPLDKGTLVRPKVEQPPSHTLVLALILGGLVIAYFVLGYLVKR